MAPRVSPAKQAAGQAAKGTKKLRDFLVAQSPVWLADQLLRATERDPALAESLRLAAADRRGVDAVRRELERAIWVADDVYDEAAWDYVARVEQALGVLDHLIDDGHADDAVELAKHAVDLLAEALDHVHDEEGESVSCLYAARDVHLRACAASRPDPVALAEWLYERVVDDIDGRDVFGTALDDYASVLGKAGQARFRDLVEAEYRQLPALAAGEHGGLRHHAVLRLAEGYARAEGVDAVVEVLAKDLRDAQRYQRVCEELTAAGQVEEALRWARRGLAELDSGEDRRGSYGLAQLRQLAVTLYAGQGRTGEAAELAWRDFVETPSVEAYQRLREQATADGSWPGWRERALAELRSKPRAAQPSPRRSAPAGTYGWAPVGHSVLVGALLSDGDVEAAWRAARDGGCAEELWLQLARRRASTHPADAVEVLRRQAETAVASMRRDGYEQAAQLLVEAGIAYERMGQAAEFADYVRRLRADHRRKRNLVAALDAARLPR
jgi:tetratricopeptide (TPR) repeat protein